MPTEKPIPVLSDEDAEMVYRAGAKLTTLAADLVKGNVAFGVGALSLALTLTAGVANLEFKELLDLVTRHYENVLLNKFNDELKARGETPLSPRPPGVF